MTALTTGLTPTSEAGEKVCEIIEGHREFLAKQAEVNDRDGRFAAASVATLAESGVLAACAPVEDGGFGVRSLHDLAVIVSRIAAADASTAIAATMHLALTWYYARTVRSTPAAELELPMRDWLRAVGRREMIVCSSVAEPGTKPWELVTTAVRSAEGWTITGRKVLASISPAATHFYSRVKGETADGPVQASAMIPLSAAGVEVKDNWNGLGLRGSGSGEVVFDGVLVPPGSVVPRGPWGKPLAPGYDGRAANTAPTVAVYLGIAEAARAHALSAITGPVRNRTNSVGVRGMVAEMELQVAAARGALHTALSTLDAHITEARPRAMEVTLGRQLLKECVCAGMIVERAGTRVVDLAMQLCGGRSYSGGHPLGRMYRDIRAAAFMRPWAPAEEWVDFVAEATLDRP
ncbi:acyl-CoA dehydrogenase [Amycolatopsis sp. cmx-4-61]|uniref:acyl-CoA dehydrogenase n=1 Tax=Amycolatopsis sp. cmx-4-61 TaxID=2790937 RepID=UPI00397A807B